MEMEAPFDGLLTEVGCPEPSIDPTFVRCVRRNHKISRRIRRITDMRKVEKSGVRNIATFL